MKFKKIQKKEAFFEATKEPLRLLVLAVIPFGVAYFTELPYEWAGIVLFFLRWFDSFLHELGKKKKDEVLTLGLTRF